MVYKVARTLTIDEAAYLAGLIDGEGTITLSRRHANEMRQLVVSISSTEPELLDWAANATGVGKITRKRTASDKHAPGGIRKYVSEHDCWRTTTTRNRLGTA
jgi:hypothetical protein